MNWAGVIQLAFVDSHYDHEKDSSEINKRQVKTVAAMSLLVYYTINIFVIVLNVVFQETFIQEL